MSEPERIGDYLIARRLGAGGQAVVYEAYDKAGRRVAIKVLHAGGSLARSVAKEVAAARRVASFCTARILDARLDGAQPYIVSEYVAGPSLRGAVTERGPYAGEELRRLAIGIATAMAAIHEAGVAHCDLKPDNVLLGPDGPRVIDFGIARIVEHSLTTSRGLIGTPGYMAPELFRGDPPTPAADVFAWGAVILFAATGSAPFARPHVAAAIKDTLQGEADLSSLEEPLRGLVEAALAQDPSRRPTAHQLLLGLLGNGNDSLLHAGSRVAAELGGASIDPHLGVRAEQVFQELSQEQQGLAGQLMLRMVRSDGSLTTVDPAELGDEAVHPIVDLLVRGGVLRRLPGGLSLRGPALIHAWPHLRELVDDERHGLSTYQRLREAARSWHAHGRRESDLYQGAALDQAGTWAAAVRRHMRLTPVEADFLAGSGGLSRRRTRRRRVLSIVLTVLLVAAVTLGGVAEVNRRLAVEAEATIGRQRDEAVARQLAAEAELQRQADPGLALLLSVAAARTADIPDTRAALIGSLAQPGIVRQSTRAVGLGQDGRSIIEAGGEEVLVRDAITGRLLARVPAPRVAGGATRVVLSTDRRYLAVAGCGDARCTSGPVTVVRTAGGKRVGEPARWGTNEYHPSRLWFDDSGRLLQDSRCGTPAVVVGSRTPGALVACAGESSFGVQDAGTGEIVSVRKVAESWLTLSQLSPDGRLLAVEGVGTKADEVQLWSVRDGKIGARVGQARYPPHASPMTRLATDECVATALTFDPSSRFLAGEHCGLIVVWAYAPGVPFPDVVRSLEHPVGAAITFAEDGGHLTALGGGVLQVVDTRPLTRPGARIGQAPVRSAAFSPDGRLLAAMDAEALRIVNADTGRVVHEFKEPWVSPERSIDRQHLPEPLPPVFSKDGRLLAVGGDGAEIVLIDVPTWRVTARLTLPHRRTDLPDLVARGTGDVMAMDLSPDGTQVAAAIDIYDEDSPAHGSSVRTWDTRTGRETTVVPDLYANTLAYAPDGEILVTGSLAGLCTVDLAERKSSCDGDGAAFRVSDFFTENLGFTPDGRHVVIRVIDGSVALWDPRTRRLSGPTLRGHEESWISAAAFSRDGTLLATGGYDNTARLWSLPDGTALGQPFGHGGDVLAVALDDSGQRLRTVDAGGGLHSHALDPGSATRAICAKAGRDLTAEERRRHGITGPVCQGGSGPNQ